MENDFIPIHFNKGTSLEARSPLLNSYGFDLSDENLIGFQFGKVKFTIKGFKATAQFDALIATIKVALNPHIQDAYTHVQKFDLYNHDRVNNYCRTAAFQLQLNEAEIKTALCSLRERLEKYRLDEVKNLSGGTTITSTISKQELEKAREILKSDNLLDSIEGLLQQAGLVTETENGLRLFMILLSRHFNKPLHALFQGSPQLSKMIMETITSTLPPEQIYQQTSMSASPIYYTRDKDFWRNKVLYMSTIEKNFKGASTIKEFIDNNVLKRQTTESDYQTRQLYASNKVVNGPICLLGYSEDEGINNRFFQECFFLRVEENEKNKSEMLEHYKRESAGLIDTVQQAEAIRVLMAVQTLINPVNVVIPYAMDLALPESIFQPLRSLPQLLTFIKTVTLLHQHLLKRKKDAYDVEYIEATPYHLKIAIELFKSILISQSDILSQSQRQFLEGLRMQIKEPSETFKIPDMLSKMKISKSVFYREFKNLKELGYIKASGGNKKKGVEYKIAIWEDYQTIKDSVMVMDELVKKIEVKFPEVSQKIPSKTKAKSVAITMDSE